MAAGTGDLSIAAVSAAPKHITGIDISPKMLEIGREKIRRAGLSANIDFIEADSEAIPFPDNKFDVAMAAFGVRNFADPLLGLSEMSRVIKRGGMVLVLEFSKPSAFPFKQIYYFYFLKILPFVGRLFSKNKTAYSYLPESVMQFPDNENFIKLMSDAGLSSARQKKLTLGVASIYTAIKQ